MALTSCQSPQPACQHACAACGAFIATVECFTHPRNIQRCLCPTPFPQGQHTHSVYSKHLMSSCWSHASYILLTQHLLKHISESFVSHFVLLSWKRSECNEADSGELKKAPWTYKCMMTNYNPHMHHVCLQTGSPDGQITRGQAMYLTSKHVCKIIMYYVNHLTIHTNHIP